MNDNLSKEDFLDRITPLYQLLFSKLSGQQGQLLAFILEEDGPCSSADLSAYYDLDPTGTRANMNKLWNKGIVKMVGRQGQKTLYDVNDIYLRAWYKMTSSIHPDVSFLDYWPDEGKPTRQEIKRMCDTIKKIGELK